MEEILRKITIDEVYISPLKRRRVRREDGSEIMEEVPHAIRPSGSMIMDAVVQILFFRRVFQINNVARILGVDPVNPDGNADAGFPEHLPPAPGTRVLGVYGPEFVANRRVLRFLQPVVVVSCVHEGDRVFAGGLSPQPSA